jgi:hypothetical protein
VEEEVVDICIVSIGQVEHHTHHPSILGISLCNQQLLDLPVVGTELEEVEVLGEIMVFIIQVHKILIFHFQMQEIQELQEMLEMQEMQELQILGEQVDREILEDLELQELLEILVVHLPHWA